MSQDKNSLFDKQKTVDESSNCPSIDYPEYLDTIKFNLQYYLPLYKISVISKLNQIQQGSQNQVSQLQYFSIIINSSKLYKQKFEIITECYLNQKNYNFYVKHLITLNNSQLKIRNRDLIALSLSFCNKINSSLQNIRLVIHPVSGNVYFQTKALINQGSLNHLKKNLFRQDCYYTEIIIISRKRAQKYLQLILFINGQIELQQLVKNDQIANEFSFFVECLQILRQLQKSLFYISFCDLDVKKQLNPKQTKLDSSVKFQKTRTVSENYQKQSFFKQNYFQKSQMIQNFKKFYKIKNEINNSLQYFSENTENMIKIFQNTNLYQNVNLSQNPFYKNQLSSPIDKTLKQTQKQSTIINKKILSYIQIIDVQGDCQSYQSQSWKSISQGGFGVIQLGTVKFKNLSSSYTQPQTGFAFVIRQQLIRKRDKNPKKGKIQRQRRILQKLRFFTHPNIMNFYISFQVAYQHCIFSDYTPNMSLDLYLKKNQLSINLQRKIFFIIQSIEGLKFLHQRKIVHLDIKPGNMLISKQLRLLLSDFGEAFVITQDDPVTHQHAYTIPYCAPQIFLPKADLTQKVDIYAIGVCMLKIILGASIFQTFLKRKFVKRLCKFQIENYAICQKFQKSFLFRILKIISFIAFKTIQQCKKNRPQLSCMKQVLSKCQVFIQTLCH